MATAKGIIQAEFKLFGTLKRSGAWYVAHCPPLDITTQGRTQAEAKENLIEASELFLTSCLERGTLDQALKELGFAPTKKQPNGLPANAFPISIPIPMRFDKTLLCRA
jgi:predicted RNase H-like HicB family nuclease